MLLWHLLSIYASCGLGPEHAIRRDAMPACGGAMEPVSGTSKTVWQSLSQTDKATVFPSIFWHILKNLKGFIGGGCRDWWIDGDWQAVDVKCRGAGDRVSCSHCYANQCLKLLQQLEQILQNEVHNLFQVTSTTILHHYSYSSTTFTTSNSGPQMPVDSMFLPRSACGSRLLPTSRWPSHISCGSMAKA